MGRDNWANEASQSQLGGLGAISTPKIRGEGRNEYIQMYLKEPPLYETLVALRTMAESMSDMVQALHREDQTTWNIERKVRWDIDHKKATRGGSDAMQAYYAALYLYQEPEELFIEWAQRNDIGYVPSWKRYDFDKPHQPTQKPDVYADYGNKVTGSAYDQEGTEIPLSKETTEALEAALANAPYADQRSNPASRSYVEGATGEQSVPVTEGSTRKSTKST